MKLDDISDHTKSAIAGEPALAKLEPLVQIARRTAPWHLWLDKYAWAFAERVDLGKEQLEKQRKQAAHAAKAAEQARQSEQAQAQKNKARELRTILDQIPAEKPVPCARHRNLPDPAQPSRRRTRLGSGGSGNSPPSAVQTACAFSSCGAKPDCSSISADRILSRMSASTQIARPACL